MALTRVSGPDAEPLTLAEAKAHLRVDHTADDALINGLIAGAREHTEGYLRRALITQQWVWKRDGFGCNVLELPLAPARSVDSIVYIDGAGVSRTWAAAEYQVDIDSELGRVSPAFGYQWPLPDYRMNAVSITFTAGYGSAGAAVPAPIKHGMLLIIEAHYDRDAEQSEWLIKQAEALMFPYRVWA